MPNEPPVIAIDGLSASGKGTVASAVAKELNWHLLDSGLLYRITGFLTKEYEIELDDVDAIVKMLQETVSIEYSESGVTAKSQNSDVHAVKDAIYIVTDALEGKRVLWQGEDITAEVRGDIVSQYAAKVAALPRIRSVLIPHQRAQRKTPGLVADGRDMGTVVFDDAPLKIFLEASLDTRTQRRMAQLGLAESEENFIQTRKSLKERDDRDELRDVAPAKPALDAITLDSSCLSVQETVEFVMNEARTRSLIGQ